MFDHEKENRDTEGKLTKIKFLLDHTGERCMSLFQPHRQICDGKNKGRYGLRQYIREKPVKWGFKLWVLADSLIGYTYNDVYTGKDDTNIEHGLSYSVLFKLLANLLNQGYHLFCQFLYKYPVIYRFIC